MNAHEQVNQFLRELGQRAGLGAVTLSAQGTCGFEIGDGLALHLEAPEAGATLHLMSALLRTPEQNRERFFSDLLKGNYGCVETEGAALALDPDGVQVCLGLALPLAGLDYLAFENTLANFVAVAQRWRKRLVYLNDHAPGDKPEPLEAGVAAPWLGIRV